MFDSIYVAGKGFKGPIMHELRGSLLQKEIVSIDEYLKEFKNSWHIQDVPSCQMDGMIRGILPS